MCILPSLFLTYKTRREGINSCVHEEFFFEALWCKTIKLQLDEASSSPPPLNATPTLFFVSFFNLPSRPHSQYILMPSPSTDVAPKALSGAEGDAIEKGMKEGDRERPESPLPPMPNPSQQGPPGSCRAKTLQEAVIFFAKSPKVCVSPYIRRVHPCIRRLMSFSCRSSSCS